MLFLVKGVVLVVLGFLAFLTMIWYLTWRVNNWIKDLPEGEGDDD
jgi:cytoskeletal protein RodZ